MTPVLLAVPDLHQEPELVARSPSAGVRIVRRCVDAVDLFAAAAADHEPAVVVSAGLPRLERDPIERMSGGRLVVGLATGDTDHARLTALGVHVVVRCAPDADSTLAALRAVLLQGRDVGVWRTGVWSDEVPPTKSSSDDDAVQRVVQRSGRIVAVWGPVGAPGRTTVALGVAEALADGDRTVALVDADTYGPSVALALGLVDDASGLAVACRHADNGTLSEASLMSTAHRLRQDWYVLGGIGRPDRWADLRPAALDRVWAACRSAFDVTVVDVGFCLEGDDGTAWASRRNAAGISALGAADQVLAVAESSSLGAARLIAGWSAATSAAPLAEFRVVQNRSRGRFREHAERWSDGVRELGISAPIHPVPLDARAAQRTWSTGRSLGERARLSPLRRALGAVAQSAVSR